jgi:RNA polymerase sigma factor (sigma-70 family)
LPAALAGLPERERTIVLLLHGYGWHLTEVADTLGVSKSTVQTHDERGMKKLRTKLGVGK